MPTASKLVAGIYFAVLAWFAAELVKHYLPDGTQFGFFSYIAGVIGLLTGWLFMGKRAGDTMAFAMSYGFSASVILSFWNVFYFAFEEMIHRSMNNRYRGPTEALMAMVDLMREYGAFIFRPDVLFILVVGGIFGGWLTEHAGRRWA
ncbi:TrgA family protein [Celeribacter litoreus]|uniref:TrgA family protein n=1 Tax=Celeribacter litoreus TaxID=2876714 RepID=UPI001CCFBA3A|nr:TrgA family protein [Celeribacter litoreus]MCA0043758.1 TrgA family protein [Celeribacter litoreus]